MRKPNSQFDQVCKFINSLPIGTEYTCKQVHDIINISPERLGWLHCMLNDIRNSAGVLKPVKRGTYKILAHIPDFVTCTMLEANWGYNAPNPKWTPGSTEPRWVLRGKKWKAGEPNPHNPMNLDQNGINSINPSTPASEHSVVVDICERLDGLMPIKNDTDFGDERDVKFIYKYGTGKITKHRVHKSYHTASKIGQSESLLIALSALHDLTGQLPEVIAEGMLFDLESGDKGEVHNFTTAAAKMDQESEIQNSKMETVQSQIQVEKKLITMEDIRGQEIYWKTKDGKLHKGTIIKFDISADGESVEYTRIKAIDENNGHWYFDSVDEYYTSKEKFIAMLTEMVEAL